MSAPLPIGRAEHRDCTEGKKHRAKNASIPRPRGDCAGQRQEGEQSEVARLGVHSRPRLEGAAIRLRLPCARVDGLEPQKMTYILRDRTAGHLSGNDRATRCPTGKETPAAERR